MTTNNTDTETRTAIETTRNLDALTFGVEIETWGLGINGCAEAIREIVGGEITYVTNPTNGNTDTAVKDRDGRNWICTRDGSISGHSGCEVVTPVLRHSRDMSILQEVARNLRARGARTDNAGCGIHIHVGLTSMGATEREQAKALKNLCNIVYKHEDHINIACGVSDARENDWACRLPESFVAGIKRAKTLDAIMSHYYDKCGKGAYGRDRNFYKTVKANRDRGYRYGEAGHYCSARYSGLNLHNICFKSGNARTVEFRLFDATLHAGKLRAYVTFCLAMAARAANVSRTSYARRDGADSALGREQARWFASKLLGLVGDRYNTVRKFVCDAHFDVAEGRARVAAARNGEGYTDNESNRRAA